ncbi:inosine-uridine nucleoside N-ribohydrolase [Paenibacillus sp. V4I3]|uniref:nucleoside hydrolase n=1 Tax=unclassified Paenibacillus TaxID=185978 RepID=UPI00278A7AAC|nr:MULTISPECIES: nucleoside hydrolase [unclassified Paenibacillus]MDQ0872798.1 inosine-uridine nucleoside N-ribohydrolase [Paenibacillus sp. V4I3]MDQ0891283.1 inosine-uridine nucleoside N-ribohydrolase [Paenibacillus sp. V4I9]
MITNVLFFSHTGVDDAVALMYASFTKTINIIGIVCSYGGPISLFPLNVTHKAIVTQNMSDSINRVGKVPLFKPIFDVYYDFYKTSMPQLRGAPTHDLLPMMALVNQHMFQWMNRLVHVVTKEGIARGQSIADFRPNTTVELNTIRIAVDLDYRQFYWNFMINMIDKKG